MSVVTWTTSTISGAYEAINVLAVKGASTTGNGDAAPAQNSNDGLPLAGKRAFAVHIEAQGTIPAGAGAYAYLCNPATGNYNRAPRYDFICAGGATSEAMDGFDVAADASYLAYIPFNIGAAADVHIVGVAKGLRA